METLEQRLSRWDGSLCLAISVAGLISRCRTVYKWKAPFRALVLREALLWRMNDLGQQIVVLENFGHILGSRILLRSALETTCILIYLNSKIEAVCNGKLNFFEFEKVSLDLLMGSKDESTSLSSVNILTMISSANKKHGNIQKIHKTLSECAHPNYSGVLLGYSETNYSAHETHFGNRWKERFGKQQEPIINHIYAIFEHEYDKEFTRLHERLEKWIQDNDSDLELNK